MFEENISRERNVDPPSDRQCGLIFSLCFLIFGIWPGVAGGAVRVWAVAAGVVLGAIALVYPQAIAPFNRLWAKLGLLLGQIVSPLALGILFFLVVTPTGLVMRLLGNDHLRLRRDPKAKSYWIGRDPPGPARESFPQQF